MLTHPPPRSPPVPTSLHNPCFPSLRRNSKAACLGVGKPRPTGRTGQSASLFLEVACRAIGGRGSGVGLVLCWQPRLLVPPRTNLVSAPPHPGAISQACRTQRALVQIVLAMIWDGIQPCGGMGSPPLYHGLLPDPMSAVFATPWVHHRLCMSYHLPAPPAPDAVHSPAGVPGHWNSTGEQLFMHTLCPSIHHSFPSLRRKAGHGGRTLGT